MKRDCRPKAVPFSVGAPRGAPAPGYVRFTDQVAKRIIQIPNGSPTCDSYELRIVSSQLNLKLKRLVHLFQKILCFILDFIK